MAKRSSGNSNNPPKSVVVTGPQSAAYYTGFALSILGALATILGTFERFGFKGAFLCGAIVLAIATTIVGSQHWTLRLPWKLGDRVWFPSGRATQLFLLATIVFLVITIALHLAGWGKAYFWREDYTLDHGKLPIDRTAFGLREFLPTLSEDLGTQQARERESMLPWLKWSAQGASIPENREPAPDSTGPVATQHYCLLYVRSAPFDSRYKDLHVTLSVVEMVSIDEASAFLVSGIDEPPWWKGTWRQMFVSKGSSNKALDIVATNPNPGERLIVLARIKPDEGDEPPPSDRIVPFHAFEVHR